MIDNIPRCEVCGWPLAETMELGCVPGNCSQRGRGIYGDPKRTPMLSIRCSALPRIAQCPASANPPAIKIDPPSEAGTMGTAVHLHNAAMVRGLIPDIGKIANEYDIDPHELEKLCGLSRGAWRTLRESFPGAESEVPTKYVDVANGITLTGTMDVRSVTPAYLSILDWKSGWADRDHTHQVRGYGWSELQKPELAHIQEVRTHVLNLRRGVVDTHVYTRAELAAWWESLVLDLRLTPDRFSPGEHCGFCQRFFECDAQKTMTRYALEVIRQDVTPAMTPEQLAGAIGYARVAEKFSEGLRAVVKAQVVAAGGVVPYSDTHELAIEHGERREIDFSAGEDVIVAYAGDKWREAVSVGNGDIERVVKATAARGDKGKQAAAFWRALETADAINVTPTEKLVLRKRELAMEIHDGPIE